MITQTKKISKKLSARQKIQNNAIPWILLILLAIVGFFIVIYPLILERIDKQEEMVISKKKIADISKIIDKSKIELKKQQNIFKKNAGEVFRTEERLLPKTIKTSNIAKSIELFSIEMNNFDIEKNSVLELQTISFSKPKIQKELDVSTTRASMKFKITKENIPHLINFIQTNAIPHAYEKEAKEGSSLSNPTNYQYIKQTGLPLGVIKQLKSSLNKSKRDKGTYSLQLNVEFYSTK